MITAIIRHKENTLVLELPHSIYDIYEKLQSIGIMQTPKRIPLTDNEDEDIGVKLFSESDFGQHLLLTLNERNTIADANMLFERLYEDNVAGKIDDARFAKMSKRYEQEQGENAKKIKALRLELKKDESKRMDIDDFLETVRRYTDATTITKRMVAELIDHIEVYHAEKQDGVTNQRVVIYYNCIGAFDVPDRRKIPEADIIMETRKRRSTQLRPGTGCGIRRYDTMKAYFYCRVAHDDSFSLEQ